MRVNNEDNDFINKNYIKLGQKLTKITIRTGFPDMAGELLETRCHRAGDRSRSECKNDGEMVE